MQMFRMSDDATGSKAAIPVADKDDARHWNGAEHKQGIFIAVNTFDGPRRKELLNCINAWAVDIDEGTKSEQIERIKRSPLVPSWVVETKNGHHVWWVAKPGAQAAHWNAIVLERLVPYFGADKNARDLCRILRAPGFMHWKNPLEPFKCRLLWNHNVSYTETQMGRAFTWVPNMADHRRVVDEANSAADRAARSLERETDRARQVAAGITPTETIWEAISGMNQMDILARLSGSSVVNGERYTFRPAPRGRYNMFVDGKGTACFIDEHGMIGSPSGGGPTITAWCRWMGKGFVEILDALKREYSHLADLDELNRKNWRAA